jgi:hypothetical protein
MKPIPPAPLIRFAEGGKEAIPYYPLSKGGQKDGELWLTR